MRSEVCKYLYVCIYVDLLRAKHSRLTYLPLTSCLLLPLFGNYISLTPEHSNNNIAYSVTHAVKLWLRLRYISRKCSPRTYPQCLICLPLVGKAKRHLYISLMWRLFKVWTAGFSLLIYIWQSCCLRCNPNLTFLRRNLTLLHTQKVYIFSYTHMCIA